VKWWARQVVHSDAPNRGCDQLPESFGQVSGGVFLIEIK